MKQINILPSGCQAHFSASILHFDEYRIFYASTLAVYVLNATSFRIEKILSLNHKAITSISVSPHDRNKLAISGADGSVCLWDVENEVVTAKVNMSGSVSICWNPHSPSHIAVLSLESPPKLYNWDISKDEGTLSELLVLRQEGLRFSMARWNPNKDGQIAIGSKQGIVLIFNYKLKKQSLLQVKDRQSVPVVDLRWDRLSSAYLLVAYQFFVSLWDTESAAEVLVFERQTLPITSIAWMDWTPGNFVTANSKNGFLKVWNASQKQPLDSMRFNTCGINSVTFSKGQRRIACAGLDGALSVFNVQSKQLEYRSEPGHTETIFDCKFCPTHADRFCSASYDATVKVWSIDMKLEKTLYGNGDVIYSVDWSPNGNMVVASSLTGLLTVWDVPSGRELARFLHHGKASYCVAWNKLRDSYIASTSADRNLFVIQIDEAALYDPSSSGHVTGSRRKSASSHRENLQFSNVVFRFEHPAGAYGCSWCPTHDNILATGCHDGKVRIFNVEGDSRHSLLYLLTGPRLRAFGVSWSPLLPGTIATGCDDRSIYIWEISLLPSILLNNEEKTIEKKKKQMLSGHTGFVRGMSWNYEHRHLLISGSWDSTVRLWEVDTGTCLYVLNDHVADVYSIVAHPERPFTYLTCSRDTTIRMWELEGVFTLMRLQATWDGCLDRLIDESFRQKMESAFKFERQQNKNSFKFPGLAENDASGDVGDDDDNDCDSITLKESIKEFKSASQNQYLKSLSPFMAGRASSKVNAALQLPDAKTVAGRSPISMNAKDEKGGDTSPSKYEAFKRRFPDSRDVMISNYHRMYTFFSGCSGVLEVLENALPLVKKKQTSLLSLRPTDRRLVRSEGEVLSGAKSNARRLESSTGPGGSSRKKLISSADGGSEKVDAAISFMRAGDFQKFCELMIEAGEWTTALAVAPSVSHEYWQQLSTKYAYHLASGAASKCNPELSVPHLLAAGKDADAVEFYLRRNDPSRAMIIAKMSEKRKDLIPDLSLALPPDAYGRSLNSNIYERVKSVESVMSDGAAPQLIRGISLGDIGAELVLQEDDPPPADKNGRSSGNLLAAASHDTAQSVGVRERTMTEIEEGRRMVKVVAINAASKHLENAQPLLAAAQMIAVDEVPTAIELLSNSFETDLAYFLANIFDWDTRPLKVELANRCASLNAIDLAIDILQTIDSEESRGKLPGQDYSTINTADVEVGLLISRYCNDSTYTRLISERQLKGNSAWMTRAKEEEEIGSDTDAVVAYTISRQYTKAASMGLEHMKKHIREALDLTSSTRRLIRALKFIKATDLPRDGSGTSTTAEGGLSTLKGGPSLSSGAGSSLQAQFLHHLLWYSAHEAAELGLIRTGADMLRIILKYTKNGSSSFALSEVDVEFQLFFFLLLSGDAAETLVVLKSIMSQFSAGHGHSEVHSLLRVIQATLLDDLDFESTSARIEEAPTSPVAADSLRFNTASANSVLLSTALRAGPASGIWGPNTSAIFQSVEKLCVALSLPNVAQLFSTRKSWRRSQESSISFRNTNYGQTITAVQGSLLPASNQHLKMYTSCISGKQIHDRAVTVDENGAHASINEAVSWIRVFPFSPSMDGKLLSI